MDLTAAILAGGLGTRLRSAVADRPKVLAPVAGRPFLMHLLDQLANAGIRRVVLLTGHRAEQVRAELGEVYEGMRLDHVAERLPLGTAGAVRNALPWLKENRILLLNGDSFCDIDIARFYDRHCRVKAGASLALVHLPNVARYGQVQRDRIGRVIAFQEKEGSARQGWINGGVYLIQRDLISKLPANRVLSLERDVFPAWVSRRLVYGMDCGERFIDIGTPESYSEAEGFFSASIGRSPARC
jgi:D-glycero-alpha-D-manno-heptose 1-phosphate guanylyltransferase